MTINFKVVITAEGIPQLRNVPKRSAAAVVIEGRSRARSHIDNATRTFCSGPSEKEWPVLEVVRYVCTVSPPLPSFVPDTIIRSGLTERGEKVLQE